MTERLDELLQVLDLEELEINHYRGRSPNDAWQRVYGGQVLGQALVAASRTVDDPTRNAHSLHAYFLRPGDPNHPILYTVDRIRDGRSFTTRRVVAIQHGRPMFNMSISFQTDEPGLEHAFAMPEGIPDPESLTPERELRRQHGEAAGLDPEVLAHFTRERPIEYRALNPQNDFKPEKRAPKQMGWMRVKEPMPDDLRLHQCALAYLSDWTLLDTCTWPHGVSFMQPNFQTASLDHAMWFHSPFRADEWLLYVQDSPAAGGARGFNRGLIYSQDGALVASVAQEGLIRLHGDPKS